MIVINNKNECCGCESCANICPKQAISMVKDEKGFIYPIIDNTKCINCGLCNRTCPLQNELHKKNSVYDVYAIINKDKGELMESASGGAFSALAHWALEQNGIVIGCSWDETLTPRHIKIDNIKDLTKIQGSKYVQSRMGNVYQEIKGYLNDGKLVLFSGTPCQCDGLRYYLQRNYSNLVCVELICHGVPSYTFFRDYLDVLEKKIKGKIIDLKFRDKKRGWGALLHIIYLDKNGKKRHKFFSTEESYYYTYFWNGNLYRESCYECKYSTLPRKSDITIGDYWGVQKAHPEINVKNGVSVLIASTTRGKAVVEELKEYAEITDSNIESAIVENGQLVKHSIEGEISNYVWNLYLSQGADKVWKDYVKRNRIRIIKGKIKRNIPLVIKELMKKSIIK